MSTWTLLSTSAPDFKGNVSYRARRGSCVAEILLPAGQEPTDETFDADFAFALSKFRAKR